MVEKERANQYDDADAIR